MTDPARRRAVAALVLVWATLVATPLCLADATKTPALRVLDQGRAWTPERRALFYGLDQGSQLIPLAWLEALKQDDGRAFLDGSMARYGFLPMEDPTRSNDLPVGFSEMPGDHGPMVGVACAACHTRDIEVGSTRYRIDGGPAFIDFVPFARDLDAAVKRVRDDPQAFQAFAAQVLGGKRDDAIANDLLRADVDFWWTRFHVFIDRSLPEERPWGPSRMDAITLIYNRLAGLDIGSPPTDLVPANIEVGYAPVRYPFLWNASRQDLTQWTGFAANGNAFLAMTRNLGEEYGVFGTFHPQATTATFTAFNRNYSADNSADFAGLAVAEDLIEAIAPPVWPWPYDKTLARTGKAIFDRPTAQGGCVECHGIRTSKSHPGTMTLFETPIIDVGTDRRAWQVVLRKVAMGSMQGASIRGLIPPLKTRDLAIDLLRASVIGAIADHEAVEPQEKKEEAVADVERRIHDLAYDKIGFSLVRSEAAVKAGLGLGSPPPLPPALVVDGYEARVLQGVWAAAPYLHNGSVPTLAELLKPPAERVKRFQVGRYYDPTNVGLAAVQAGPGFTLETTGCDDLMSGNSNCGHAYGTNLTSDEKKALLEYLKIL